MCFLRQQNAAEINYCLSDFIAPLDSGKKDYIGAFIVTMGSEVEKMALEYEKAGDDYSSIMVKALGDRLVEAMAEYAHKLMRDFCGYGENENLSNEDLIYERYRGIRPAPGYPACPEHTEKAKIWKLLDGEKNSGAILTENFAMYPPSSVSGFYFNHPQSKYFALGKISKEHIAHKRTFSFKTFMVRRLWRTLPNYIVVLALYIWIDGFHDHQILPPLWKMLTFTANFGLRTGTAFSHSWSLCVEEQFYLALPIIALILYYKKSIRLSWCLVAFTLIGGMALRTYMWITYTNGMAQSHELFNYSNYYTYIYYFTFCHLDPIICGVIIALIRNFYSHFWYKITSRGDLCLILGVVSLIITCYMFMSHEYAYRFSLIPTIIGFTLLGISFGLLLISALSPNSILHWVKIPFAERIAVLSFAIYLIQKPLDHLTAEALI